MSSTGSSHLFRGGTIHPVSSAPLGPDGAILISGGRIVDVGDLRAVQERNSMSGVVVHDLDGRAVLPGFVDAHAHPLMLGQMDAWVDVSPSHVRSIDDLVKRLAAAEADLPAGAPLRAFGYEHRNLTEGRHPTRWDLDRITQSREVYVMNASGHGGVVNSYALNVHGLDRTVADPVGGTFERDERGELTGVLWDAACDALTGELGVKIGNHGPNFHMPDSQAALTAQFLAAEDVFLRSGVTTVGDAQASRREVETYLDAMHHTSMQGRYHLYITSALLPHLREIGLSAGFGSDWLSIVGIKLYADGTLGGWTAYFPEGYVADPCRHGQLYHEPGEYAELFAMSAQQGLQVATHAQSPTAIQMVIDATAATAELRVQSTPGRPVRVEHCGLPLPEQVLQMAALEMMPVNQPQHAYNWGAGVVTAVGSELGSRFNPLGEFVAAGLDFALSSDAPVARPRPMEAVMAAATRITKAGEQIGPDALRITVARGIEAHTLGGARAIGRAAQIGSLERGKLADLSIWAADPLAVATDALGDLALDQTWVDGEQVR